MISFKPEWGRLGNFLFRAAHCIAFALKNNDEFSMPNKTKDPYWSPIYLQHLVHPQYESWREDVLINEQTHHWQEIEYMESWRGKHVIMDGYWQTEKYFKDFRNEILYLFSFPWELRADVCSIHARFGDYLLIHGKHIIVDEPYLRSAMALITERTGITRFKVFSDDIPMFKQRFGFMYDFEYSTNSNEVDDLVEISCCHSHVNSSSTFSWWGAWLNRNPDKIIITQSKWFQDGWGLNTKDLIPENWIKL